MNKKKKRMWDDNTFKTEMKKVNPNIEILGTYINARTKIKCKCIIDNYVWETTPSCLLQGHGCAKCTGQIKRTTDDFKIDLYKINKNIEVIGEYINVDTKILVKCKIDGHEWSTTPNSLLRGSGCPLCDGKVVKRGVNDIATLRPDLVKYFDDIEDAYNSCVNSGKKHNMHCPDCGHQKKMTNSKLSQRGFFCQVCGDGVSYPNKFSRAFLLQLPIENFITEYYPKWSNGRFYDNYFEYQGQAYILEMDGEFHYKYNNLSGQTAEESQKIDKEKDLFAIQNNIKVIRIDCRESTKKYIVNNILSSELSNIFDLSKIDWDKCNEYATSNIVKQTCELYNTLSKNTSEIAKQLNMRQTLVQRYLNKGNELGWCTYVGKDVCKITDEPMIAKDKSGNIIAKAKNAFEIIQKLNLIYPNVKFSRDCIRNVCKKKHLHHRGIIFEYI